MLCIQISRVYPCQFEHSQFKHVLAASIVMHLKVLLVLLDFYHYVVYVEEFSSHGDILERLQGEELGETMVKLDHLCQDSLIGCTRGWNDLQGPEQIKTIKTAVQQIISILSLHEEDSVVLNTLRSLL